MERPERRSAVPSVAMDDDSEECGAAASGLRGGDGAGKLDRFSSVKSSGLAPSCLPGRPACRALPVPRDRGNRYPGLRFRALATQLAPGRIAQR